MQRAVSCLAVTGKGRTLAQVASLAQPKEYELCRLSVLREYIAHELAVPLEPSSPWQWDLERIIADFVVSSVRPGF
jgi:5'-3' exonuclease